MRNKVNEFCNTGNFGEKLRNKKRPPKLIAKFALAVGSIVAQYSGYDVNRNRKDAPQSSKERSRGPPGVVAVCGARQSPTAPKGRAPQRSEETEPDLARRSGGVWNRAKPDSAQKARPATQ